MSKNESVYVKLDLGSWLKFFILPEGLPLLCV